MFTRGSRVVVRGTDLQSPSGMGTREKMAENGKGKAAVGVVSRLSADPRVCVVCVEFAPCARRVPFRMRMQLS